MKILFTLLSLLTISNIYAENSGICPDEYKYVDGVRVSRGTYASSGECYVSVQQAHPKNLFYRDFSFASDGQMMIFSSYGDGPVSSTTGASEFYFFPRLQHPNYEIRENVVAVIMANGKEMLFDRQNAEPISMDGVEFKYMSEVYVGDKSGFEVVSYDGLYMNSGFNMGMNPTWYLNKKSTFVFEDGKKCVVKNSDIFKRSNDENYWIHQTDEELMAYLEKKCK